MPTKDCFKCGESKPLSAFYKHPQMKDGRVNKCKECNKFDVRDNRRKRIDFYRAYDRERGSRQTHEQQAEYRARNPEKYKAHCIVNNAVRAGKLNKAPCVICGEAKAHGHHDNYARPLDVVWLCAAHHKERHAPLDSLRA